MANYRPAVGALAERKATKVEHCPCGTGAHTKKHTHASIGAIQVRRDPRHFAARARLESRAHADVSAFGKLHGYARQRPLMHARRGRYPREREVPLVRETMDRSKLLSLGFLPVPATRSSTPGRAPQQELTPEPQRERAPQQELTPEPQQERAPN